MRAGVLQRVALAAACLFLFLLPITHTTPLRLVCLGIAACVVVWTTVRQPRMPSPRTGFVVAVAFWVLIALVACVNSIEPAYSWGEFRNEVVATLLAFGVFFVLSVRSDRMSLWSTALCASFVCACLIAIFSYLATDEWLRSSFVGDRNAYSTYVVLAFPFLIFLWTRAQAAPRVARLAVGAAILLAVLSGAFTQNRNMWFAVLAECLVWAALAYARMPASERRRVRARYAMASAVLVLLFATTLTYVIWSKATVSNMTTESQYRFDRDPRFAIWRYAASRIEERPLMGHGFGRGILRKDFRTYFDDKLKWHGHNVLINYVIEAGVLGAVALLGLLAAIARQAWTFVRSDNPAVARYGMWIAAMLVGIVIKMTTDDILIRENALLFWSVLGMLFGSALRMTRSARALALRATA